MTTVYAIAIASFEAGILLSILAAFVWKRISKEPRQ
jgi:hypothetical protein